MFVCVCIHIHAYRYSHNIAALFTGYRQPYCTFRDLQRIRKAFAVLDALGPSSYLSVKFLSLSLSLLLSLSLSLSPSPLPYSARCRILDRECLGWVYPTGRCAYLPSVTCYRQSLKPPLLLLLVCVLTPVSPINSDVSSCSPSQVDICMYTWVNACVDKHCVSTPH